MIVEHVYQKPPRNSEKFLVSGTWDIVKAIEAVVPAGLAASGYNRIEAVTFGGNPSDKWLVECFPEDPNDYAGVNQKCEALRATLDKLATRDEAGSVT